MQTSEQETTFRIEIFHLETREYIYELEDISSHELTDFFVKCNLIYSGQDKVHYFGLTSGESVVLHKNLLDNASIVIKTETKE